MALRALWSRFPAHCEVLGKVPAVARLAEPHLAQCENSALSTSPSTQTESGLRGTPYEASQVGRPDDRVDRGGWNQDRCFSFLTPTLRPRKQELPLSTPKAAASVRYGLLQSVRLPFPSAMLTRFLLPPARITHPWRPATASLG